MNRVFLGLGANIGNREENLRQALRVVSGHGSVVAVSSLYRSQAVVLGGQAPGPDFLNAVCEIETDLSPQELLLAVKAIEHEIGRRPTGRWTPRPIDIDILLFGDEVLSGDALTIPHPFLVERNFVLLPLAELAPEVEHPLLHRTIDDLTEDADFDGLEHLSGPDWAAGALT